ncbi:MAG TPA: hypothetical protein VGP94_14885, partial [Tepidisphaeraceae bacterium]|nr:hypothetical protein [Tepidisphaeraceae bacterium]
MQRPRRILAPLAAAGSFVLCIATAASWIRSHSISERLAFRHYTVESDGGVMERMWSLRFSRGRVHLGFGR